MWKRRTVPGVLPAMPMTLCIDICRRNGKNKLI
jgi:hypothetical protein